MHILWLAKKNFDFQVWTFFTNVKIWYRQDVFVVFESPKAILLAQCTFFSFCEKKLDCKKKTHHKHTSNCDSSLSICSVETLSNRPSVAKTIKSPSSTLKDVLSASSKLQLKIHEVIKTQKTCTVFLSSYRNISGSLGELEMLSVGTQAMRRFLVHVNNFCTYCLNFEWNPS